MILLSNQPPTPWEPTSTLYSKEGRVKVGLELRSMVYVHRVQEGTIAMWNGPRLHGVGEPKERQVPLDITTT